MNEIKIIPYDDQVEKPIRVQDVYGFPLFKSVTVFPTDIPKTLFDQIKIYRSGGASQLVIYEPSTGTWRGVTIT